MPLSNPKPRKDFAEGEKAAPARDLSRQGNWIPLIDWSHVEAGNRGVNRHGHYELHEVPVGISLRIEEADKVGPIITAEKDWEQEGGVGSLLPSCAWRDEKGYHLLYTAHLPNDQCPGFGGIVNMCYLASDDGYTWSRKALNQVEWNGSKENNIIADGPSGTPFIDPKGTPEERFKAIGQVGGVFYEDSDEKSDQVELYNVWKQMEYEGPDFRGRRAQFRHWVEGWTSPDGIHWTPKGKLSDMPSDGGSAAQYDPDTDTYFAYLRVGAVGRRATGLSRTRDFWHWPEPEPVLMPDPQDPPDLSFYGTEYFRYPTDPNLHCAFVETYNQLADDNNAQIAFSRDMVHWFRPERRPILPCGAAGEPDSGGARPWGGVFELSDGWWATAYRGHTTLHNYAKPNEGLITRKPGVIMLARWLPHRFAGIEAEAEGRLTISTVQRGKDELRFNYRCGHGGTIKVELIRSVQSRIHPDTDPIPGFTFEDCDRLSGDDLNRAVTWKGSGDLSTIGDTVAIRLRLFRAKLFAFSI